MSLIVHTSSPQPAPRKGDRSSGIVLDALPYVEPLDPHYEHQAISLIEEELARSSHAANEGEHPTLSGRFLPASLPRGTPAGLDLNGAPLAAAAYQAIVKRHQESGHQQGDVASPTVGWSLPDPFAASGGLDTNKAELQMILDLETSIKSAKINFEQNRIHLTNLELHSQFCTPDQYQRYHTLLEQQYLTRQCKQLDAQRMKVDAINAQRMEEQDVTIRKVMGLKRKWEGLVEKNGRLDLALVKLEGEVLELERVVGGNDEMEGGTGSKEH